MGEPTEEDVVTGAALRAKMRRVLTAPSGHKYLARRPAIADLIRSGNLPEGFVESLLEEVDEEARPHATPDLQTKIKNTQVNTTAQRIVIAATLLRPRVMERAEADDEVEIEDIPPLDRTYLFNWAMGIAPDSPINLADGGVTTRAELTNFSDGERPGEPVGAGGSGPDVRQEPGA